MNEWQSMMMVKIWMTTMTLKAKEDHLVVSILVLHMLRHKSHRVDRLLKMRLLETKFLYLWSDESFDTCTPIALPVLVRSPGSHCRTWKCYINYINSDISVLLLEKFDWRIQLDASPESSTIELFFRKGKPVTLRLLLELDEHSIEEQWYNNHNGGSWQFQFFGKR